MASPISSISTSADTTTSRLEAEINEARENSASDFTEFLTLLTAQLQNQDPLQPLDSTQFVEQLASFSAVEQQIGTNEKLSRLVALGEAEEMGQLGVWIGKTVDAENPVYELNSNGMTVDVPTQTGATSVTAVILDSKGAEVARVPVEDTSVPFVWTGTKDTGQRAANGLYAVSFAAEFENSDPERIEPTATGRIVEARVDEEGPLFRLESGAWIRSSDVSSLRLSEDVQPEADAQT